MRALAYSALLLAQAYTPIHAFATVASASLKGPSLRRSSALHRANHLVASSTQAADPPISVDAAVTAEEASLRLGEPWWESDPSERDRQRLPGRRAFVALTSAIGTAATIALIAFSRSGALTWSVTSADVARSALLPWWAFAAWRVLAAAGTTTLSIRHYLHPTTATIEDLDRKGRRFTYSGWWRFQGLTGVSWLLINAHFLLAAALTLIGGPATLACLSQTVMSTAFACALLVTTVVSFWLIPSRLKANIEVTSYFKAHALLQHNANVALMTLDVWFSALAVDILHMPIAILFCVFYVLFHQTYRYEKTRTLLYPFLNWTKEGALSKLVSLAAAFAAFYWIGFAISAHLRPRPWGAPLVAIAVASIMRLREPPPSKYAAGVAPAQA